MVLRAPWSLESLAFLRLAVVRANSALLSVPAHNALVANLESSVRRRLVRTNWLRTLCWTLRLLLAAAFVALEMRCSPTFWTRVQLLARSERL